MPNINFPSNPSVNDTYTFGVKTWIYTTSGWQQQIMAGPTGATGPTGPGYINIPQNSNSADYTCVIGDAGKHIFHPAADTTARTFTIPANSSVAYEIGTTLTFVNQHGAGVITININTDTCRLAVTGVTTSKYLAADGIATAIKITSTEWLISGAGLTT
jgi:hypothetical protein